MVGREIVQRYKHNAPHTLSSIASHSLLPRTREQRGREGPFHRHVLPRAVFPITQPGHGQRHQLSPCASGHARILLGLYMCVLLKKDGWKRCVDCEVKQTCSRCLFIQSPRIQRKGPGREERGRARAKWGRVRTCWMAHSALSSLVRSQARKAGPGDEECHMACIIAHNPKRARHETYVGVYDLRCNPSPPKPNFSTQPFHPSSPLLALRSTRTETDLG